MAHLLVQGCSPNAILIYIYLPTLHLFLKYVFCIMYLPDNHCKNACRNSPGLMEKGNTVHGGSMLNTHKSLMSKVLGDG